MRGVLNNFTKTAGSWNPPAEKRAQTGGCCPEATVLVRRAMHCICSGMPHGMVGNHLLGMWNALTPCHSQS